MAIVVLNCGQGSQAWIDARLGIPTASNFSKIVTAKGNLSASRDNYLAELLVEWESGEAFEDFEGNFWTERGLELEGEAFDQYEFITDRMPTAVGLIYKDETRMVSCSPDGLVGSEGMIELKCPSRKIHLLYLIRSRLRPREVPPVYHAQVQGQLWVSGRQWCDFVSYFPGLPTVVIRAYPEPGWQEQLAAAIGVFTKEIEEGRQWMRDMGIPLAMDDHEPLAAAKTPAKQESKLSVEV